MNTTNGKVEKTDTEKAIAKFESRLATSKHIDARDFGLNFIFPLLRKLAKDAGDQDEKILDLEEMLASFSQSGDAEVFENAKNVILRLASLLDKTMVAAGFFEVAEGGLKNTGKAPKEISDEYVAIGPDVIEATASIQAALDDSGGDGDDGDDGDDGGDGGDGDDGDDGEPVAAEVDVPPAAVIETPSNGATNAA